MVVEHPSLQDGSTEAWPADTVASHVRDFVQKFGIKTVRPEQCMFVFLATLAATAQIVSVITTMELTFSGVKHIPSEIPMQRDVGWLEEARSFHMSPFRRSVSVSVSTCIAFACLPAMSRLRVMWLTFPSYMAIVCSQTIKQGPCP